MKNNILFYVVLIILCIIFFYRFPIFYNHNTYEYLTNTGQKKPNDSKCKQNGEQTINNLVSQYNILNNKIEKNTEAIGKINKIIPNIQTNVSTNSSEITKINGSIKQLKEVAQEKN